MIRKIVSCILFIFLLSCCILGIAHTHKSVSTVKHASGMTETFAESEDWDRAEAWMKTTMDAWKKASDGLSLYFAHSKLDTVSQTIVYMDVLLKKRMTDAFLAENARLLQQLEELEETEYPLPKNIL